LTQEEARIASAELLKVTHSVDDRVKGIDGKVEDVRSDVHDVGDKVQGVEGRVQDVDHRVQSIGNNISSRIQGVDDKVDQVNRSLSLEHLLPFPSIHTSSQETSSEIVFPNGFRPLIHPPITTLHAKLSTTVQLNGFFKTVDSINGNPPTLSCGYMENVRYSWTSSRDDP
jgi:hypothetical protein